MIDVNVPDDIRGNWRIESFVVSQAAAELTALRAAINGRDEYVPPGTYKRLMCGNTLVMSNTPYEIRTNRAIIHNARGHVLINGLGLGMVLTAILRKADIQSVTIIEAASEVIELVGPSFRDDPRVYIIHGDALTHQPATNKQYDVVWHDIWNYICADNLSEMHRLHRKYARRTMWQDSWGSAECKMWRDRYRRTK